jgi:hypothetical protein
MGLVINEETQGYLDRGWFPVTENNWWALQLTELQLKVYLRLLAYWRRTGSRYISEELYETHMRHAGYEKPGPGKKALAGKGMAMPFELIEGCPLIRITGISYYERGQMRREAVASWPCKTNALTRDVAMWCMPEDVKPIVLEQDVARFYGDLLREVQKTGSPRMHTNAILRKIMLDLYASDERAAENLCMHLRSIGLFRSDGSQNELIQVRPYRVNGYEVVTIPLMCQKVWKEEVGEQPVDTSESEVPACAEVDIDKGEDLRLDLPPDLMEYEITEFRALVDRAEEALEQEAREIVSPCPLSTIEQIVVGNEVGLDDILDRAQLLWKVQKALGSVSGVLVMLRSAREDLVRAIGTYNRFDNEE